MIKLNMLRRSTKAVTGACLGLLLVGGLACDGDRSSGPQEQSVELSIRIVYATGDGGGPSTALAAKWTQAPYWQTHDVNNWNHWPASFTDVGLIVEGNHALTIDGAVARGTIRVAPGPKIMFAALFGDGLLRYTGFGDVFVAEGEPNEVQITVFESDTPSLTIDDVRILAMAEHFEEHQ